MKKMKFYFILAMIMCQTFVFGQKIVWDKYIKEYKEYAISEMQRTGIPASIKMAQAILESNAGRSVLAVNANNHFGIKCGGAWAGPTYYREDDDYGSDGKLIESCFRKYDSSVESFIAHSEFLLRNSRRYGFLFDLEVSDYKSWAKGLKKAGYATNPAYADLLISVIEKHGLLKLDTISYDALLSAGEPKERAVAKELKSIRVNSLMAVKARHGDSPYSISIAFKININRLLGFNDNIYTPSQNLEKKSVVYLQPKRSRYVGKMKYHRIRKGETLLALSQSYGIKYKKLMKRNHLPYGAELVLGQNLALRGRVKKKNTPKYYIPGENTPESPAKVDKGFKEEKEHLTILDKIKNFLKNEDNDFGEEEAQEGDMAFETPEWDKDDELELDESIELGKSETDELPSEDYSIPSSDSHENEEDDNEIFASSSSDIVEPSLGGASKMPILEPKSKNETPISSTYKSYTVEKNDNLYRISIKNGITLTKLLDLNNLTTDSTIYPGQELTLN